MKNKKIILNLLLSFVMAFVIGFGFSVKANVNKAYAINGYEVEFVNNTYSNYTATITEQTTYADIVNVIKNQNGLSSNDTITFYFYYKNPDTELQTIANNQFDYNNAKVLDVFNYYGAEPNNYGNYYFRYEVVANGTIGSDTQEEEKSITFTVNANYNPNYDSDNDETNDTLLLNPTNTEATVTVTYKVTANDGVNSLLLIPSYNKSVFTLVQDSISVNQPAGWEPATITGTEAEADALKIALESETKYEGTTAANETFITLTFTVSHPASGNYNFGLYIGTTAEKNANASSVAYVYKSGENLGEQQEVAIKIAEPATVRLLVTQNATLEIGYNLELGEKLYQLTYNGQPVQVQKVDSFNTELENDKVEYKFNGTATPVVKWYSTVYDSETDKYVISDELEFAEPESAPSNAGYYYVGISAPAHGVYNAVEEQLRYVVIRPQGINVEIANKTSEYTMPLQTLTANVSAEALANYGYELTTTATTTSPVGDYPITLKKVAQNSNYELQWNQATYSIEKLKLEVRALNQQAAYSGSEPTVDQTRYNIHYLSIDADWDRAPFGVVLTKVAGVNAGPYDIIPQVVANKNYTESDLANYKFTYFNGIFTITSSNENVAIFFAGNTLVYNGQEQNLLVVHDIVNEGTENEKTFPTWLEGKYEVVGNMQKNVNTANNGKWQITITVNLDDATANNYTNGQKNIVFTVDGQITPAPVTYKVEDIEVPYGSPEYPDCNLIEGTVYGEEDIEQDLFKDDENFEFKYKIQINNGFVNFYLDETIPVGVYNVSLSVNASANPNYEFTLLPGTYTVTKAQVKDTNNDGIVDDADEDELWEPGVKISVSADNVYYNRDLVYGATVMVGEIVLDDGYTVVIKKANAVVDANSVLDAGTYTVEVTLAGTANYVGATKTATFTVSKVKLATPTLSYDPERVIWTAVANDYVENDDIENTSKALVSGTELKYEVVRITPATPETIFDCTELGYFIVGGNNGLGGKYKLVVSSSNNDNYLPVEVELRPLYEYKFIDDVNDHPRNPETTPRYMPSSLYAFEGTINSVNDIASNLELDGYTFAGWQQVANDYENPYILSYKSTWTINKYTVTFKFAEDSETEGTDLFTSEVEYKGAIEFTLPTEPTKASGNDGFDYSYNNTAMYNNTLYEAVYANSKVTVSGYEVTGNDVVFVAQYNVINNTFTITYHTKNFGGEYQEYRVVEGVEYNSTIEYLTDYTTSVHWFTTSAWFANEDRTEAAPTTMPNHNIDVYAAVVFNVGLGDVNGDGYVNANDITLYRQWIVGGYEMTVVAADKEWETATASGFDANGNYYLVRVADNNADTSKDIRDVSITRMSIVGGYTWEIKTGLNVTGQEISRNNSEKIHINDLEGLKSFRDAVNAGNNYAGKIILLNADVTLDEAWTPISNYSRKDSTNESNWFAGVFDGNGHTISGLTNNGLTTGNITEKEEYTYGLFGCAKNAIIRNLNLTNVNISADDGDSLGALVGYYVGNEIKTNISNITVSGTVVGADNVGGVIGRTSGTYFKAKNVTVSGTVSADYKASGIVGTGNAKEMVFENCTNNAKVSSTVSNSNAGYNAVAGISITWQSVCQKVVMTGCSNSGVISSVNENAVVGQFAVDYSPKTQLDANGTWTYVSGHWTLAN